VWRANFGHSAAAAIADVLNARTVPIVPEPTSGAMSALGLLAMLQRGRRKRLFLDSALAELI
jgi:hypothetical protein